MTNLEALLAQPIAQDLGWTLLHFLWQGALIAALFAVALSFARKQSAAVRYALACGALALMAAAPLVTFGRLRTADSTAVVVPEAASLGSELPAASSAAAGGASPATAARWLASWMQARFSVLQPWMVLAWGVGVTLLSLRYLGGWAAAQRLRGRKARHAAADWQSTLDRLAARLRVSRPVRLLESAAVRVPTAIGAWRPVVLVPAAALTGMAPSHLEALLAHELAHIRRHDYLVNLLQTAVETLLFYHPGVWWVSRRARIERENCCDDLAIAATGNARIFARALADLEERRAAAFRLQTAADDGVLRRRVLRAIGRPERSEPLTGQLAAAFTLALLFGTGAAVRLSAPESLFADSQNVLMSADADTSAGTGLERGDPLDGCVGCADPAAARKSAAERAYDAVVLARVAEATPAAPAEEGADSEPDLNAEETPDPDPKDADKREKQSLSVDQLIAFKIHGVTPEFIRQVVALGHGRPSPDDLIALRVHGVTPEYVRSIQTSWGRLTLEQIVSMKIHGLSPEYAEQMKRTGLTGLGFDELLSMKIHGVTPEYVRQAQASGFGRLDGDQIVSLKVHGVTAQDAEKWKSLGLPSPTFDQVLSAKIHGVTPEFVGEMRKLGFSDLDLDDLVSLRIHGVTPEFVSQIRQLGYTGVTADQATALRIHGVSGEELKAYKAAASRLSLDEVVELKVYRISPDELRRMLRDGRLSVEDLLEDHDDEEDEQ